MIFDKGEIAIKEEMKCEQDAERERARIESSASFRLKRFGQHFMQIAGLYPDAKSIIRLAYRDNDKIRENESEINRYSDLIEHNRTNSYSNDMMDLIDDEFRQKIAELQSEIDLIKTTRTTADDISGDIRYKITAPIGGFMRLDIDNDHDD